MLHSLVFLIWIKNIFSNTCLVNRTISTYYYCSSSFFSKADFHKKKFLCHCFSPLEIRSLQHQSNVKIAVSGNLGAYLVITNQTTRDAPASLLLLKHFVYLLITDLFPFQIFILLFFCMTKNVNKKLLWVYTFITWVWFWKNPVESRFHAENYILYFSN